MRTKRITLTAQEIAYVYDIPLGEVEASLACLGAKSVRRVVGGV